MNAPMFSPVRVVLVILLACVTMWYLGAMAHNTAPHGADRTRHEQPFPTTIPAVP